MPGEGTLSDILEVPVALRAVEGSFGCFQDLARILTTKARLFVVGNGSSYYAALLSGLALLRYLPNKPIYALPSSEFFMYHSGSVNSNAALVVFSRSGETTEALEAVKVAKARGAFTAIFTITRGSEGAMLVDYPCVVDIGGERGIVMTKSFIALASAGLSTMLTASAVVKPEETLNALGGLESYASWILNNREGLIRMGSDYHRRGVGRFVVLGSGPAYPVALEASLKIKETSYTATEAMHALEFRHGPMSTVGESQLIIVINQSGPSYSYVHRLYGELRSMGADLIRLSDLDKDEKTIELANVNPEEFRALSAIIPIQLFAWGYATAKGVDVDKPRSLSRFVKNI